jgi:hypothetical protein
MTVPRLNNVREERRFLMPDVEAVRDLLKQRGDLNSYRLRTLYVDSPDGTWSKDSSKPRLRLRVYNNQDSYLECKLRIPGTRCYVKRRRKAEAVPEGMVTLGTSRYTRQEWEEGQVRVTIDQQVATDNNRLLQGFVVETKLPVGDPLPNWLKLLKPYEKDFSKWRWVSG